MLPCISLWTKNIDSYLQDDMQISAEITESEFNSVIGTEQLINNRSSKRKTMKLDGLSIPPQPISLCFISHAQY
jgi:hypothetical protein